MGDIDGVDCVTSIVTESVICDDLSWWACLGVTVGTELTCVGPSLGVGCVGEVSVRSCEMCDCSVVVGLTDELVCY